jgi:DNA (cytosine-5)-methyltransferase 1
LDTVLLGLSEVGYDAEWHAIPASALGAPHRRDRLFVLAYPRGSGLPGPFLTGETFPLAASEKVSKLGDLAIQSGAEWPEYPASLRVGDGVSYRPHTLKQMGNAVAPPVVRAIGAAYLRAAGHEA